MINKARKTSVPSKPLVLWNYNVLYTLVKNKLKLRWYA